MTHLQQAQPTTQPTHVSTEVIEEESSSVPEITRIDRLGYEAIPIKARPFYYNPIRKEKNCNKDCRFTGIGIRILADDYETEVGDYWFSNKTNEGGAACPNNLHRKKAFVEIFVEEKSDILSVPFEAIQEELEKEYVYVKTETGFEKREIKSR